MTADKSNDVVAIHVGQPVESDQQTGGGVVGAKKLLPKPNRVLRLLVWLSLWAVIGVVEGFVFVKSLVPYPKVLADQFVFENCIVLKMFMSAVGVSMLTQSAMALFAEEQFVKSRFYAQKRFGYGRVAFGTGMLGVGMAIAGNGPTMIAPALGAHVQSAWYLLVGALVAALLVGIVDKACDRFEITALSGRPQQGSLTAEALIERLTNKRISYSALAAVAGSFMVLATVILEVIFNFKEDAIKYGGVLAQDYPESIFEYPAWPPSLAGLTIGLGQIPVRMLSGDGMGGATSFAVVVSTLSCDKLSTGNSLFKSLANAWQITYNYGCVLAGAFLASWLNDSWALDETIQPLTDGFSPLRMATGAFLGLLGARIAGGCTCGHGVSGTSELSIESFVGASAIFGAAIVTRCIIVFGVGVDY